MADHADLIEETVQARGGAALSRLAASWRRSMLSHGLHPTTQSAPARLEQADINARREAQGLLVSLARPNLDALFALVGGAGCCVLLTDADGVVVAERVSDGDQRIFDRWGLTQGAVWSEAFEGTNGIGTCLAEARHVSIHGREHFHTRNTDMSCMDAPIFGPDGELIAALDVSSCRSDRTGDMSKLIAHAVSQTALTIETSLFQHSFPNARLLAGGAPGSFLAVDADDLVVGATRAARKQFGIKDDPSLSPRPASDWFGQSEAGEGLESAERSEIIRSLARTGNNVSAAARLLGIGRATLYRRMKQLNIAGKTS